MRSKVSAVAAEWLAREGVVKQEERSLFAYAMNSLFFGIAPVIIAAALGFLFGMLPQSLWMVAPFMLVRKFSGGFHLASPVVCIFTSTVLLACALGAVYCVLQAGQTVLLTCITALSTLCLWCCSPIDSAARRLSEKERMLFRRIARILTAILFATYGVLTGFRLNAVAVPLGVGLCIAALLQVPCLLSRPGHKQNDHSHRKNVV